LSDYLDHADEPMIGGEDEIISKISEKFSSEIISRIKLNPKIGPLFYECLGNIQAVKRGMEEGQVPHSTSNEAGLDSTTAKSGNEAAKKFQGRSWTELARFIPLRLSVEERRILAILDRTLKVSEYTDNIDIYISRSNRVELMRQEIGKIYTILSGQYVAMKMSKNTSNLTDDWFGQAFEIGRRYKAMNPDRLRETWVRLMYMLQDSRIVAQYAEAAHVDMKTVASELEQLGIDKAGFFNDSIWDNIVFGPSASSGNAEKKLLDKWVNACADPLRMQLIIDSVKDYYLEITCFINPINTLVGYLEKFFDPKSDKIPRVDPPRLTSLSIRSGENGARLTHSHSKQYQYVLQSLRLWREVLFYFMPLWLKAEGDILGHDYRLADTGQGLNRVQNAPQAASLMNSIVSKVMRDLDGNWIGSSVVHMGDHNVPNALIFLDKYCQIPRILGPIAHTLNQLPKEYEKAPAVVKKYIDQTFGGVEEAQRLICLDFFKHAFDGSGADNYYDAGSCIDGRLTSAWNWCGKIEKKGYFPLFLLTNFVGFDGQQGW